MVNGIEETITEEDKKDIVSIENKIGAYCKQKKLSAEQKKIVDIIDNEINCSVIILTLSREKYLDLFLLVCLLKIFVFVS